MWVCLKNEANLSRSQLAELRLIGEDNDYYFDDYDDKLYFDSELDWRMDCCDENWFKNFFLKENLSAEFHWAYVDGPASEFWGYKFVDGIGHKLIGKLTWNLS